MSKDAKLRKALDAVNKKMVKNILSEIGITHTADTAGRSRPFPDRKTRVEPTGRETTVENPAYTQLINTADKLSQRELSRLINSLQQLWNEREQSQMDFELGND